MSQSQINLLEYRLTALNGILRGIVVLVILASVTNVILLVAILVKVTGILEKVCK